MARVRVVSCRGRVGAVGKTQRVLADMTDSVRPGAHRWCVSDRVLAHTIGATRSPVRALLTTMSGTR
jgi:hypothetical protein